MPIKEIFSRLSKTSSNSPVIRLETSFGGGKTHDEIALSAYLQAMQVHSRIRALCRY